MKWKIGDKVRLTGVEWGTDERDSIHVGAGLRVTGVDDWGHVRLGEGRYHWGIYEGWEIELVEREGETMSVDISEVNVGDKVRLTRENGDEATFKVEEVWSGSIRSSSNSFQGSSWDTLEIVERAFKPVPGLYSNLTTGSRFILSTEGKEYFTSRDGAWITTDSSNKNTEPYKALRGTGGWRREITF